MKDKKTKAIGQLSWEVGVGSTSQLSGIRTDWPCGDENDAVEHMSQGVENVQEIP